MNRVTLGSNWGYWDELDGRELTEGERVRVRWPNGDETTEVVHVVEEVVPDSDHGNPTTVPNRRAYIEVVVRGHRASEYLRGSDLLLERTG